MKNNGFTLLELLVVVVILGILSLIASVILFDAVDKAKEAAIKANISAAASSITTQMTVENKTPLEAAESTAVSMNNPDGESDTGDEVKSPYNNELDAFLTGDTGEEGQVALDGSESDKTTIRGYGKLGSQAEPILVKTIYMPE